MCWIASVSPLPLSPPPPDLTSRTHSQEDPRPCFRLDGQPGSLGREVLLSQQALSPWLSLILAAAPSPSFWAVPRLEHAQTFITSPFIKSSRNYPNPSLPSVVPWVLIKVLDKNIEKTRRKKIINEISLRHFTKIYNLEPLDWRGPLNAGYR